MTTLTLHIPDELAYRADQAGLLTSSQISKLLENALSNAPKSARTLGSARHMLQYIADDFDAPLDDFSDYQS